MLRGCAVVLALVLAGCGGTAKVPDGIPVDEDGDPLATVEGFVVDEAIRPMQGVLVRILFSDVNASTDQHGHYEIRRPTLVAEDVLLSASAPGYQARTQQVQVSGHRSARMDFRLGLDPYQAPHTEVFSERGSLGCQVGSTLLPGQGMPCDPPTVSMDGLEARSAVQVWAVESTIGLAGAVLELHWDPETVLLEELHAVLRGPVIGCCEDGDTGTKGDVHVEVTGPSPLRLELTEDVARSFPRWSSIWLEVSLPPGQPATPASFSARQTFDAYATLFYVDAAPPGYRLA